MKLQDLKSKETVEFLETLNNLKGLITAAFSQRTPMLNGEKYFTVKQVTELLHISERLLNDYRVNGTTPYIKISGKILYKESDILKWLEDNYYG